MMSNSFMRTKATFCKKKRKFHPVKTMIDDKCNAEYDIEDESSGDDRWDDDYLLYVRPVLETLADWNLEEHMEEIVHLIFDDDCWEVRKEKGLYGFSSDKVVEWVSNRTFLSDEDKTIIQDSISNNGIDGNLFMYCIKNERYELLSLESPLSLTAQLLMGLLALYWEFNMPFGFSTSLSSAPLGVSEGLVSDLRHLHPSVARDMIHYNNRASLTGEGSIYGQLIAIGSLEYRQQDRSTWIPFGPANVHFTLHRRKVATGICLAKEYGSYYPDNNHFSASVISSGMDDSQEYEATRNEADLRTNEDVNQELPTEVNHHEFQSEFFLAPDPRYDRFQIGRARHSSNDIVIPGPLHLNGDGYYTGPVSRWACRIDCERLPPFRSYISIGGITNQQHLSVDCTANPSGSTTAHGIWILQPECGTWIEVTSFFPDSDEDIQSKRGDTTRSPYGNLLTDGTLIDVGGILLLFQSPLSMARSLHKRFHPRPIIELLARKQPHCPVQFHPIHFSFTDASTRHQYARQRICEEDYYQIVSQQNQIHEKHHRGHHCFPAIYGDFVHPLYTPVHIPPVEFLVDANRIKSMCNGSSQGDEENHRAYVYPSCGHVYAFHPSLLSSHFTRTNQNTRSNANHPTNNDSASQCPLCRSVGNFVPLIFTDDLSRFSQMRFTKKKPLTSISTSISTSTSRKHPPNREINAAVAGANDLYVFNPCGHVADLETCRQWSVIPLPLHHSKLDQAYAHRTMAQEVTGGYAQVHAVHEFPQPMANPSYPRNSTVYHRHERRTRGNSLDTSHGDNDTLYEGHNHRQFDAAVVPDNDDDEDENCAKGLCPYCATPLHTSRPFSKIIVQFEEDDNDDDRVDTSEDQSLSNIEEPHMVICNHTTSTDSLPFSSDSLDSSRLPKGEEDNEELNLWQWDDESLHRPEIQLQATLCSQRYLFAVANKRPRQEHDSSLDNNHVLNISNTNLHHYHHHYLSHGSAATSSASSMSCQSQSHEDFPVQLDLHHPFPFSMKKSFPVYAPHVSEQW